MTNKEFVDATTGKICWMLGEVSAVPIVAAAERLIKSDIIVTFGNGGSYANASHLVCDLLLRTKVGKSIHGIGDNNSMFSAYGNDFSFEEAVSLELERYIAGPGIKTVVLFSTSGDSKNVVRAAKMAKKYGCEVIAIFGKNLDKIEAYTDIAISVDDKKSSRIESVHAAICHAIVDLIRRIMGEED